MTVRWAWAGMVSCALVVGCSPAPVVPRGRAVPDDPQLALERFIAFQCQGEVHGPRADLERVRRAVRTGRIEVDHARLAEVLEGPPWPFGCLFFDVGRSDANVGLVPQTPLGAACDTHLECAGGYCERTDYTRSRPLWEAAGCGVCAPFRSEGESCGPPGWVGGFDCQADLVCDGTCVRRVVVGLGEPCGFTRVCGEPAVCTGSPQICVVAVPPPLSPVGSPCRYHGECIAGAFCDTSERCRAAGPYDPCRGPGTAVECPLGYQCGGADPYECRPPVPAGGPCAVDNQCVSGLVCHRATCVSTVLGLGETCGALADDEICVTGTDCVDGTCQRWPGPGAPCTADCSSGDCVDGVCVDDPRSAVGEACGESCDFGLFCDEAVCAPICVLPEPPAG